MKRMMFVTTVCALFPSTALHAQVPVTNGLKLWLKADSLTGLTNNQVVATWADSSGSGNNAVADTFGGTSLVTHPTYITNGLAGKPAVHFNAEFGDGSGDYFNVPRNVLGSGLTYIGVFRSTSTDAVASFPANNVPRTLIGDWTLNVWNAFGLSNAVASYTTQSSGAKYVNGVTALNNNAPHIMDVTYSTGGAVNLYADGKLEASASGFSYGAASIAFARVGGGYGGGAIGNRADFFYGDLAELLIYNTPLSTADRLWVDNYLADKYSIGGVPEPSSALLLGLGGLLMWRRRN